MKATINLEFTDQELTGFVERWANKTLANALGDLSRQVGPMVPTILDAVVRSAAGQAGGAPARTRSPESAPNPGRRNDALVLYESILRTRPADEVMIIVVDEAHKGRCIIHGRPRNGEELLAAIKAVHARPTEATYEVRFFGEELIGAGWVTITPDPVAGN